jgi:outer membrane receptor protein involved in Fe transport
VRHRPTAVAALVLCLLAPVASRAEIVGDLEPARDELPADKIDWIEEFSLDQLMNIPVTAATRTQLRLSEAPARILVITREQIRRRGYRYLRDIFRDLPGYQVGYGSTAEWGTTLVVRGLAGNHRLVFLLDGQRLNPPGGEEVPLFANYPLTMVDHIEVMYGPGSALYGNDAFNGIINIVTAPGSPRNNVVVSASAGGFGSLDVSALGRRGFGDQELRIGLHVTRSRPPNIYRLYPGDYSYPLSGSADRVPLDATPSPTHDVQAFNADELGYDAFLFAGSKDTHATFQIRGYQQSSAWDQNALGAPFVSQARFADQQLLTSASHGFDVGRLRSTSTADFAHYRVLPSTRFVTPLNLGDRTFTDSARSSRSYALRLEEKIDFTVVPDRLSTTIGVAGQHVGVTPLSTVGTGDIAFRRYTGPGDAPQVNANGYVTDVNPVLFTDATTAAVPGRVTFRTASAYGQLLWNPSPLFHLTAGARVDHSTRFGFSINPRLAVVSAPTASTGIKLLYGRAYLEPTPYQVYSVLSAHDSLLFPNQTLRPETLDALELVWDQRLGKLLRFTTGAFVNRVVDFINDTAWTRRYVYVESGAQLEQRRELQSANAGETLYYGSETQAQLTAGRLQVTASLSVLDGNARSLNLRGVLTEGPPPNVSSVLLKGGVALEPIKGLLLDVRGSFQSAPDIRFVRADYPTALVPAPAFVVDATVRYSLDLLWRSLPLRSLELYVDGRNLTDQRYKQPSGRPAVNPTGTPQPSRQIIVGLDLEI